MNQRIVLIAALIFIFSTGLNWLSIILSPFASPDDLGQLAFILVIFFPAAAFITGIVTRRWGLGIVMAALISALSVAAVILIKYNSSGLSFVPIYSAVAVVGYLAAWGLDVLLAKMKK